MVTMHELLQQVNFGEKNVARLCFAEACTGMGFTGIQGVPAGLCPCTTGTPRVVV